MEDLLREYLPIIIFLGLAIALGLVLLLAAFVLAVRNPDPEKVSAYECGFNAFDDARMKFDVRYYLVAILFILFDLETTFLYPWAVLFRSLGLFGFIEMAVFVGILLVGLVGAAALTEPLSGAWKGVIRHSENFFLFLQATM